jgi:hypothetical protein
MKVYFQYHLSKDQQLEWLHFWKNCEHAHPRQHLMLAEIERAKERIPLFTFGEKNGKIVTIGVFSIRPLLLGNKFSFEAVCLRGPSFDNIENGRDFLLQIISFFKSLRVGSIRISPYWFFPEAVSVESLLKEINFMPYSGVTRSSTGLIDLRVSNDEIFSSIARKTRQQINAADRLGVTISPVTTVEEASISFQCLQSMRSERGVIPMSSKEFNATFQYILKDQELGILLNANAGSTFLGTIWGFFGPHFINPSGYAVVPGATKELSANLSIGAALWWHMFLLAKERGCKWFDTEGPVENKDDPVQHFKKRFNPTAVEKINEHIYICNHTVQSLFKGYTEMKHIKRILSSLPYRINKKLSSHMQKHKENTKANMPER